MIRDAPFVFLWNDPDTGDLSIDVCDEEYGELRRVVFIGTANGGLRYAYTDPHPRG